MGDRADAVRLHGLGDCPRTQLRCVPRRTAISLRQARHEHRSTRHRGGARLARGTEGENAASTGEMTMKNWTIVGLLLVSSAWGSAANAAQVTTTACDRECLRSKVTQLL